MKKRKRNETNKDWERERERERDQVLNEKCERKKKRRIEKAKG